MTLAQKFGMPVERAYNRTDMLEKRRQMMEDWARHVRGEVGAVLWKLASFLREAGVRCFREPI